MRHHDDQQLETGGQKLADDLGSIQRSGHGQVGRSQNCAAYLVTGSSQSQSTTGTVLPWSPQLRHKLGITYAQLRHQLFYLCKTCAHFAQLVHNLQAHYIEFLVQSADFFSATASLESSLGGLMHISSCQSSLGRKLMK